MAEQKTQITKVNPKKYIEALEHKKRREDGLKLLELFNEWTGMKPKMWGPSIIGYGKYHYKYESGHEGYAAQVGFSPRKASLSLYINATHEKNAKHLAKLGKNKTSVSCLYVNKLEDIDLKVLEKMVKTALKIESAC
jgi:hypothetical protein